MRLTTSEASVLRSCLRLLELRGVFAWRNNSGSLPNAQGRPVRFGKPGSSDILGILPGGRLLAVECKAPRRKPTEAQAAFLASVARAGGVALVIDDPGQLSLALDDLMAQAGGERA